MAYYIMRPRVLNQFEGPASPLRWPAHFTVTIGYDPADLFGSPVAGERAVGVAGIPVRNHYDLNIGRIELFTEGTLSPLSLALRLASLGVTGGFVGNQLTVSGHFASASMVAGLLSKVVLDLPAALAVETGVCVIAERALARADQGHHFRYELSEGRRFNTILTDEARNQQIIDAWNRMQEFDGSTGRYLIACLYFQQALRLHSTLQNRLPELNGSEIIVNLAKALEVLFSRDRARLKADCRLLGYTDAEIDSQIVPIMDSRNALDGAHPVAARITGDELTVLRAYVYRATASVRSVLKRFGRALAEGRVTLRPVGSGVPDRAVLLANMRTYLNAPELT